MYRGSFSKRRTKIVCTIGPASGSNLIIERLIRAGMNVARLNLSHGTYPDHLNYIKNIRSVSQRLKTQVAILIDLPGPKYRTGKIKNNSILIKRGDEIVLTTSKIEGSGKVIPIDLDTFARNVKPGNTVLINDGAMQVKVQEINGTDVKCKVVVGGLITGGRGVVVPGANTCTPFITENLIKHIEFALEQQPDYIALSFVSCMEDVAKVKTIMNRKKADIPIISKIERGIAVENFDSILKISDGIMVARGDLGVDIALKKIPHLQKEIIKKCNRYGKTVITATQMLESMVNAPRPTRAEVTDVANAILDGTDAIMLSAETSIGKYPIHAVKMMAQIAEETESRLPYEQMLTERGEWLEHETSELISYNACYTAHWLKASAIVAYTQTGSTAHRVSKYRPSVPILAITPDERIARRLILNWGVQAFHIPAPSSIDELFASGGKLAKDIGLAKPGDIVIITGGIPLAKSGTTNMLKVERIQ